MSEMIATANAKSIEEIKSFLSKQKETYKVPYETHPADRLRQCVFAGTTNRQDFLPRDRTGNRRFIPVPVDAELAEVHILDNEEESRTYIDQLWAEAMTIYNQRQLQAGVQPRYAGNAASSPTGLHAGGCAGWHDLRLSGGLHG